MANIPTLKRLVTIAIAAALIVWPRVAPAQTAAPPAEKPGANPVWSTETVFTEYCGEPDANQWLCARKGRLTLSEQWEIVDGYCRLALTPAERDARQGTAAAFLTHARPVSRETAVCAHHDLALAPMAVEYDFQTGQWSSSNKGAEVRKRDIRIDPLFGYPTAFLQKNDQLGVIVNHINPLLYQVTRGDLKVEDIEQVKGLQQLLGSLGPLLGGLVGDLGEPGEKKRGGISALQELHNKLEVPPTTASSQDAYNEDLALAVMLKEMLRTAIEPLEGDLRRLTDERRRLQLLAQELQDGGAWLTGPLEEPLENPAHWAKLFGDAETGIKPVGTLDGCHAIYEAFAAVVTTPADKALDVHGAAIKFLQLHPLLTPAEPALDQTPCVLRSYIGVLKPAVEAIATVAALAARDPAAPYEGGTTRSVLITRQAEAREAHLGRALTLQRIARQLVSTKDAAKEALKQQDDTRKAALALHLTADRVRMAERRVVGNQRYIVNRLFVQERQFEADWTKVLTESIKISVSSQYADQIPTERARETVTSYKVRREGSDRLSFGVGLIYTRMANPAFAAADPDPKANTSISQSTTDDVSIPGTKITTTVTKPELKVIAQKDSTSLAGAYASFVNYRLWVPRGVALNGQFGVALSAANPALYFGMSVNAGQLVTVGFGCGAFRVKALGVGADNKQQKVNDTLVTGNDDIRLDNKWATCFSDGKHAWYLSLNLNLSGLSLFSGK